MWWIIGTIVAVVIIAAAEFLALGYDVNGSELEIRSGILFKRIRKVRLDGILWKSTISVGKAVLVAILHTSCGNVIIFTCFNKFNKVFNNL